MLSLRARLFIIISLIVLIILGISLFLLVRSKKITLPSFGTKTPTSSTEQTEQTTAGLNGGVVTNSNVKVAPISSVDVQKKGVQQLAKIFFERLNSYSSQSKFQNLLDVKDMLTGSYWKELSANMPAQNSQVTMPTQDFSSQQVQVYSVKLSAWTTNSATVDLQYKLIQDKNGVVANKNAEAKVTLVKVGNDWLISKSELVK